MTFIGYAFFNLLITKTEQLNNYADEKVRLFCVENKRLIFWAYVLLGVSTLSCLMIICFTYCDKQGSELNE